MKKFALILAAAVVSVGAQGAQAQTPAADMARWQRQAQGITIIRDDWGIAHVYGKTDADAVFGMVYAQAEDDWMRVEQNFITNLGLQSLAEGESRMYMDLRARLYCDPDTLKAEYARSPATLKVLMVAWADALNFYLAKHPEVKPKAIKRWEPWMALSFTEGSIGGDLGSINVANLQAFYGNGAVTAVNNPPAFPNPMYVLADERPIEPGGSNGAAVAPSNTTTGRAILLINPHTSHYFRSEVQMVSEEGLNAYGAATWGQFFIYQGFNAGAGWMHTTSAVDDVDEYAETVVRQPDAFAGYKFYYLHGNVLKPVAERQITIPYTTATGSVAEKSFTVYSTHHGPIVRALNGKWVAVRMMNEHIKALQQSYGRTKATDYASYRKVMDLHTNSSNNTIFADSKGNIAYLHANYVGKRDTTFNWQQPVDGSNPKTDWTEVFSVEASPFLLNPSTGWLYNSNNNPWSAAGPASPKQADYPRYMDTGSESDRGRHMIRVLENKKDYTLDKMVTAAYDNYQLTFATRLPVLIKAWDDAPASDSLKAKLAEPIAMLRAWDLYSSTTSIPTSLAIYWQRASGGGGGGGGRAGGAPAAAPTPLQALSTAMANLTAEFGSWKTPWGDINRFQRIINTITPQFDDTKPSIPVGWTSPTYGSIASYAAAARPNTKKWYGTSGNSFVAVVEFGKDSVRARAITAGGESGDINNKHFNDQAARFAAGDLRPVYYYRNQLQGHTEREYHPGN